MNNFVLHLADKMGALKAIRVHLLASYTSSSLPSFLEVLLSLHEIISLIPGLPGAQGCYVTESLYQTSYVQGQDLNLGFPKVISNT